MNNFYNILGVNNTSSQSEIKKAYHKLATRWHPDKNSDNIESSEKQFKEISEAYQTLSDSKKRFQYDKYLNSKNNINENNYNYYEDSIFLDPRELFNSIFNDTRKRNGFDIFNNNFDIFNNSFFNNNNNNLSQNDNFFSSQNIFNLNNHQESFYTSSSFSQNINSSNGETLETIIQNNNGTTTEIKKKNGKVISYKTIDNDNIFKNNLPKKKCY